ncbi:MAG: RNA 2',3'-cyclic phosphodiesterase [Desulfoarculaceae bacterium]|nr:RNA 2',3'-cyclic phosphodiesterase [Desulfoarculaceae bacterium]
MKRLFVALDLPPAVKLEVAGICLDLPGARWVADEQIHLTLRFIGEVDSGVFQDIREGLAEIQSPSFAIRLVGLGFFPPRGQPRVLWAGVEPVEPVVALRNRVELLLVRLGLDPEGRRFSPHVTMARLRDTPVAKLTHYLAGNAHFASSAFEADTFHLYSSVLTKKGAMHQIEASYPLILLY